jgi:hypothetical protein
MAQAPIVNQLLGRAVMDIDVVNPDNSQTPFLYGTEIIFNTGVLHATVNSWKTWSLSFSAITQAAYENRVVPLLLSKTRMLKLRWGIDTGVSTVWRTSENFRVFRATPNLASATSSSTGFTFELVLVDALYELTLGPEVASHRGSMDAIVGRIATKNNLKSVIEPTQGQQLHLIQSYTTDYDFLLRLRGAALNVAGFGSYYFFIDGDALHFHTREYQQSPQIVTQNVAGRPGSSNFLGLDDAQTQASAGGNNARLVVYDPLSGLTNVLETDPMRYTRFSRRLSEADGSSLAGQHVGPNLQAWEQGKLQAYYSQARDQYQVTTFALGPVLTVGVGSIVAPQLPSGVSSATGLYFVTSLDVTIEGGRMNVIVKTIRGEVFAEQLDQNALRDVSGDALSAPSEAPGKDPTFTSATTTASLGSGNVVPILPP